MAYQAWSVVFGEQPSAAKWNILGTNDAAFYNGGGVTSNGLVENFFRGRVQLDNNNSITNSAPTGLTVQFGWVQIIGNGTTNISQTVTFGQAFSTLYYVGATFIGATATDSTPATSIIDFEVSSAAIYASTDSQSTTTANIRLGTTATFANTRYYGASWMAIGVV